MQFKANTPVQDAWDRTFTFDKVTPTWVIKTETDVWGNPRQKSWRIYVLEDGTEAIMLRRKVERHHIAYCFRNARKFDVLCADGRPLSEIGDVNKVQLKHTSRSKAAVAAKWEKPDAVIKKISGADWRKQLKAICKGYCVHVSASYITGVDILETARVGVQFKYCAPAGRYGNGGTYVGTNNGQYADHMNKMTAGRAKGRFHAFDEGCGMTVNQFVRKYPKGTFSVCNHEHCWTIKDGTIVDWDYSRLRRITKCVEFRIED